MRPPGRSSSTPSSSGARATPANRSSPSTSMSTTGAMSTASRATMAWQPSSNRVGLDCRWAHLKTVRTRRVCMRSASGRTGISGNTWSSMASIALVRTLRAQEIRTAVVSSSNNCAAVLEAAGISHLFDARVDGKDITRLVLRGSLRRMRSSSARGASTQSRRARSSWRTRSPVSKRDARAGLAALSVSIAAGNRRRCARPAPMWW